MRSGWSSKEEEEGVRGGHLYPLFSLVRTSLSFPEIGFFCCTPAKSGIWYEGWKKMKVERKNENEIRDRIDSEIFVSSPCLWTCTKRRDEIYFSPPSTQGTGEME
jgi:hypothetical protein